MQTSVLHVSVCLVWYCIYKKSNNIHKQQFLSLQAVLCMYFIFVATSDGFLWPYVAFQLPIGDCHKMTACYFAMGAVLPCIGYKVVERLLLRNLLLDRHLVSVLLWINTLALDCDSFIMQPTSLNGFETPASYFKILSKWNVWCVFF